jgi:threonine/homoserine/homoserine lactone efflux protein
MLFDLLPGGAAAGVYALAVLLLALTPGVDTLLTVTRTLQGGPRAGAAAALGILAGCGVHTAAVAAGLATLLVLHPGAFVLLQWAGAAYLLWLGLQMLRAAWRGDAVALGVAPGPSAPARSLWADFRVGVLTNVLNPKVALFFVAFLPQFVPAASPSPAGSLVLLGLWFVLQNLFYMLTLVLLAARLRRVEAPAAVQRWLNALGGAMFVGLALRLLGAKPGAA